MGNFYMEATQINYRRDEKLKTVDQKLQELSQESAIDTDIAPVFKSNITYHPGDLVYYRNKLYVFTAEHTGAWAAGDVTATDVSTAMNTAIAGKADYADIAGAFSAETAYTAGDLVIYNGIIYRCTNDHTGDWDADDFSATTIGAELNAINSNFASLGKHEVLTIAANTYTSWEDALTALYTAYGALTADQKRTSYLIMDDLYVAHNSAINYGHFSRSLLVSSSGTFGLRTDMYALANKVAIQAALYDGEAADVVDITANAQTNKVALYY